MNCKGASVSVFLDGGDLLWVYEVLAKELLLTALFFFKNYNDNL